MTDRQDNPLAQSTARLKGALDRLEQSQAAEGEPLVPPHPGSERELAVARSHLEAIEARDRLRLARSHLPQGLERFALFERRRGRKE